MSSYRIIKRGVLFGAEGDPLVKGDYATTVVDNVIKELGKAVPVVFGTRQIEPVMVAWSTRGRQASLYYGIAVEGPDADKTLVRVLTHSETVTSPQTRATLTGVVHYTERMVLLSARMVLCVGQTDSVGPWLANDIMFNVYNAALPEIFNHPTGDRQMITTAEGLISSPGASDLRNIDLKLVQQPDVERLVVAVGDADLFGGGTSGGLGFPINRSIYDVFTRYSQFWLTSFGLEADPLVQDAGIAYRGLTSLYFNQFNFGGSWTPARWRVGVSRVRTRTARSGRGYQDQWEATFRDSGKTLVAVSTLREPVERLFYLIPISENVPDTGLLSEYLKTLPYTDTTAYQFIYLHGVATALVESPAGGHVFGAGPPDHSTVTSAIITSSGTVIGGGPPGILTGATLGHVLTTRQEFLSVLERVGTGGFLSSRPVNFTLEHADAILYAYTAFMSRYIISNESAAGVVVFATTNLFGFPRGTANEIERSEFIGAVNNDLARGSRLMSWLTRPPASIPSTNAELTKATSLGILPPRTLFSDFPFAQEALRVLRRYPPEVRMVLWNYYVRAHPSIPPPRSGEATGAYIAQRLFNYPTLVLNQHQMEGFYQIDALQTPIQANDLNVGGSNIIRGTHPAEFRSHFRVGLPFGESMNPIHALRETLTNKDWGEGIDESKIDDEVFYQAAVVCHNEGLDYCNVLTDLGQTKRLIKDITDYVDGVLYYNPATDKVTIKLIRDDYVIEQLPTFNESVISEITGYKRQHSKDLINSVTIRFHDAVKGSNETFTIHDLVASERAGKVVSAAISYDGCATARAAEVVAKRDLAALSQSVISFRARLTPPATPLGLGDPIVVSYRDLGIEQVVMRVSSISYGDGLTGGISVNLIQDVFATIITSELVVPEEPEVPVTPPPPPVEFVPFEHMLFVQASLRDLISNNDYAHISEPPFMDGDDLDPGLFNRLSSVYRRNTTEISYYRWKVGLKYVPGLTDNITVSIGGAVLPVSIGVLLTSISPLSSPPYSTMNSDGGLRAFSIRVAIKPIPQIDPNSYIQVNGEEMQVQSATTVSEDVVELLISKRAQTDTVSTGHHANSYVFFLDHFRYLAGALPIENPGGNVELNYLSFSVTQGGVVSQQRVTLDSRTITQPFGRNLTADDFFYNSLNRIRAVLPHPPAWIRSVQGTSVSYGGLLLDRGNYRIQLEDRIPLTLPAGYEYSQGPGYSAGLRIGGLAADGTTFWSGHQESGLITSRGSLDTDAVAESAVIADIKRIHPSASNYTMTCISWGTFREVPGAIGSGPQSWQRWVLDAPTVGGNATPLRPVTPTPPVRPPIVPTEPVRPPVIIPNPRRLGWGYRWGKDWGSGDATGWNYDWDNNFGD